MTTEIEVRDGSDSARFTNVFGHRVDTVVTIGFFDVLGRIDSRIMRPSERSAGGRVSEPRASDAPDFDVEECKRRNVVERCFNRLKQFRGLANRFAKRAAYFRSELLIASMILWLR